MQAPVEFGTRTFFGFDVGQSAFDRIAVNLRRKVSPPGYKCIVCREVGVVIGEIG